jgi:hypothetical protein
MTAGFPILWEVLVPTVHRLSGKPIRVRFHRVWDEKVRAITGGLSIMPPIRGQWVSPEGQVFFDRMIPVRIAATRPQMDQIMELTKQHYDELEVFAYLLSDTVIRR